MLHHATEANVGKAVKELEKQASLPWRFEGVAHLDELDVPFTSEGVVQVDA